MQFIIGLILLHVMWRYCKDRKMRTAKDNASPQGPASWPSSHTAKRNAPTRETVRQKRARMKASSGKPTRVYPANAEGRAEEARDKAAQAARDAAAAKVDRPAALSPQDMARLARMVQHLRPGMRVEDIDALTEPSGGLLTRESLSSKGQWSAGQQPCRVIWQESGDRVGEINVVYFPAAIIDPESVGEYGSPEELVTAIPGAARAYRTLADEYEDRVTIDLPDTDGDFLVRVHYVRGGFSQTEYQPKAFAHRIDAQIRKRDEAERAEKAAQAAKRDAWAILPVDEKLAQVRAPRLAKEAELGVDGALIDWAGGHSSWGESSNRWGSFVNWLITKATPDDRHNLVSGMNWDHGTEVFMWIIQQPDTDIATVAKTIWQAGASYHLREMSRADGTSYARRTGLNELDLIDEAVTRIRAGFYVPRDGHDPIGFDGPPIALGVSDDPLVRAAEDRLFPPILRGPIPGRPESELRNGLPKIYWEVVN